MTTQQWDEFLDKLDFVQLSDRWNLLPLHWLDDDPPENITDLGRELVEGLLEVRDIEDEEERLEKVEAVCREYRSRLAGLRLALDSRLCPPGSRVTLRYLDPENLGEGDCLITVGSWDRVGYLIAEKANPGGEHVESVGDSPVRQEAGELPYRNILLFPDKGTPSPRAFRALCEKTFRQARGLGARHFTVTHLHLPQTGLADRFAAAELVSAVRQLLRDGPGTTVDILCFSHRNYEDYVHWFNSLKELSRASAPPSDYQGEEPEEEESHEPASESEVAQTLKSFARRSTEFASEATASVTRWFSSVQETQPQAGLAWRAFTFEERELLNRLYLGLEVAQEIQPEPTDAVDLYLYCLQEVLKLESGESEEESRSEQLLQTLGSASSTLGPDNPLRPYFDLLGWRLHRLNEQSEPFPVEALLEQAVMWDDLPLIKYLQKVTQEDSDGSKTKPPIAPGGSKRTR